jgi:hypothetical protein
VTFTDDERRALARAARAEPLEPEAELLRVLIMREQGHERCDLERIGRLIDRLVRVVRAQRSGQTAGGRDPRIDEMLAWLAEIARQKRSAALAPGPAGGPGEGAR